MLEIAIEKKLGNFLVEASFQVGKEAIAILGASGSGKSVTLRCIAGLLTPDKGRIELDGKKLFDSQQKINISPRYRDIGYVFQNYALFPHLSVADNVAFGLANLTRTEKKRKVAEMLEKVQLTGLEKRFPHQLSGGQQQRVALARTLITQPKLLLLDEPFSALDSHIRNLLEQELLSIIQQAYSGPILLVTHDIQEAYRLSSRILIFSHGKTLQFASKEEVISNPANLEAALITGCKNYLPATVIGGDDAFMQLKAGDLVINCSETFQSCGKNIVIGFRSDYLKLSSGYIDKINCYPCDLEGIMEGLFYNSMIVKCAGFSLRAEVSKEETEELCNSPNLFIHIPAEKIFLLPENNFEYWINWKNRN